jgi:predicted lactoylglutathione lyase
VVSAAKDYYADKRSKGMLKDKNFVDLLVDNQKFKQFARRQRMENDRVNSWKKHKRRKLEK